MIASLQGKVAFVEKDAAVIDVSGVGFRVYLPAEIVTRLRIGEQVHIYTHLVVREDMLALYGFETRDAIELFALLLGANGVGPKLALSVLDHLSPDSIKRAVFNEQAEVFARVGGVGRKTAQNILIHLQGKIKPGLDALEPISALTDTDTAVLEALTALGYSVIEAQAALQAIPKDSPDGLESRLMLALQYFSKP